MRALIAGAGSAGDVNPLVAVGRALAGRGHEVALCANAGFARDALASGLEFVPSGGEDELLDLLRSERLVRQASAPFLVIESVLRGAAGLVAALEEEIARRRPDVLLRHHVAIGARWVAERHGIPCAVAVVTPSQWHSARDLARADGEVAAVVKRLVFRAALLLVARPLCALTFDRGIRAAARRLGFPAESRAWLRELREGAMVLGLWSKHFRPPFPDDPERSVVTGFAFHDRSHSDGAWEAEIGAFLDAGEPPVVFSLGSTVVHSPRDFWTAAAEACRRLSLRAIFLSGGAAHAADLPGGVRAFAAAPFASLFPRARAVVHHGGIGSTAQAIRAGKPALVVPFVLDQPDVADRARRLGVARVLPRARVTAESLARELERLLADTEVERRAAALGEKIRAEDGAAAAAKAVESLVR